MNSRFEQLRDKINEVRRELADLQVEARDAGTNLLPVCGLLRDADRALAKQSNTAIGYAKAACEDLTDRANQAKWNDEDEFATLLDSYVAKLSPLVAFCIPEADNGKEKKTRNRLRTN